MNLNNIKYINYIEQNAHMRWPPFLWAFTIYIVIAALYFGIGVLNHPNSRLAGVGDDFIYIWSLAWWKYAISHHLNFFITHKIWAPNGYNLTRATSLSGIFLLLWPLQLLSSTEITYNAASIFSPALAAGTMFLLCYWLVKSPWPAFFGGYFFGFSGYMLYHMHGHLNLVFSIFLFPLIIWIFLLYFEKTLSKWIFLVTSALCLSLLFLISIEMFATFTACSGLAFLVSILCLPKHRRAILKMTPWILISYFLTAILVSPYLYYFFKYNSMSGGYGNSTTYFSNDLLGFLIPDRFYWLTTEKLRSFFSALSPEQNAYLGLPLFFILMVFGIMNWAKAYAKFLIILVFLFAFISLGPVLHIAGEGVINLYPNLLFFKLPFIKYSLSGRYAVYMSFVVSLIVAYWLSDTTHFRLKYFLSILAVIVLMPTLNTQIYPRYLSVEDPTINPPFFSKNLYQQELKPNDNVLVLPYSPTQSRGFEMYAQAKSNFYFKLAGGYIGTCPDAFCSQVVVQRLLQNRPDLINPQQFQKFLRAKKVNDIVITDSIFLEWQPLLSKLNIIPIIEGGVRLYKIPATGLNRI